MMACMDWRQSATAEPPFLLRLLSATRLSLHSEAAEGGEETEKDTEAEVDVATEVEPEDVAGGGAG